MAQDVHSQGRGMTNDERDRLIRETHDMMVALNVKVQRNEKLLDGNGSGGIADKVSAMWERHTSSADDCSNRLNGWMLACNALTVLAAFAAIYYSRLP